MEQVKKFNLALNSIIFQIIVFSIFVILISFLIYPKIQWFENEKSDIGTKIDKYEEVRNKWISYEDFQELNEANQDSQYTANLIKKIDKEFYEKNFINNGKIDYTSFYNKKVTEINNLKNNSEIKSFQDKFWNILPIYVETNTKNENWVITDLTLATYIESILHTFSLNPWSKKIELWNFELVETYKAEEENFLDSSIFYFPYKLTVEWYKSDILDFLLFLENVWTVKTDTNWQIQLNSDTVINKTLDWYENWNILNNELIDIVSISTSDNLDSKVWSKLDNESYVDYIKRTQWNDEISLDIELRFYLKGMPNYKVLEYITKVSDKYEKIKNEYESAKADYENKKTTITNEQKKKIDDWLKILNELWPTILKIKKEKTDLEKVYTDIINIDKNLDYINSNL